LCNQEAVQDFGWPVRWDYDAIALPELFQNLVAEAVRFVFKAPSQGDRASTTNAAIRICGLRE
jgi:hypothetical protein